MLETEENQGSGYGVSSSEGVYVVITTSFSRMPAPR